jgi:alkyl hydroperoxide reductase subunit F
MLDQEIIEQLSGHFAALSQSYVLSLSPSDHAQQGELRALLESLATTSTKLTVIEQGPRVSGLQFDLLRDSAPTGIRFRGIPGGHEFTSLVLAILNADGKGRLPDEATQRRIRRLRGPIDLVTYVSLSCTNCPDVVQALNQMAVIHGDLRHTMVDGGLSPDEVSRRGIQAVPAVFAGEKLVHVGKTTVAELIDVLEEHFGLSIEAASGDPASAVTSPPQHYDVVVFGGGPAGASAAIYSARKGLRTALVAQKVGGQVQETLGIENLISVPYTEGPRLAADLDKHLRSYPVDVLDNRRVEELDLSERKWMRLRGGEELTADALILAMGARWRELGIPGEKEYLGHGVAFCPHCDGPFYKGRPVAVVGGGNSGVEAAIDLAGICSHVTLFEFVERLKADAVLVRKLESLPNVTIISNARTTEILGDGAKVTGLRYQERATEELRDVALEGVFVQIGLQPNSSLVKEQLETNRFGEIVIDSRCRTSIRGVYAAGDVTTVPFKQIVIAMGEGAKAALSAFDDRIRGDLGLPT